MYKIERRRKEEKKNIEKRDTCTEKGKKEKSLVLVVPGSRKKNNECLYTSYKYYIYVPVPG